ncbi:hypothetical protein bcere0011_52290 [Bacillus cereus m1550]|nr:hypothetical protein bcere0011_52290 [Bacillus cereus m1550]
MPHKAVAVGYVSENERGDWARTADADGRLKAAAEEDAGS